MSEEDTTAKNSKLDAETIELIRRHREMEARIISEHPFFTNTEVRLGAIRETSSEDCEEEI